MYTVPLADVIEEYNLKRFNEGVDLKDRVISCPQINRPALQLTGFFDYFDSHRMQIIGIVEYTYLQKMDPSLRKERLGRMFEYKLPCLVLCRGLEPFPEMIEYANEFDTPVLGYDGSTTDFIGEVIRWLKVQLAPRVTLHGVLLDIYGEGVLIIGESGVGKSETALELIKRGHRLVADDAVEIKRVSQQTLIGSCPELIRYFIELRGIGIINILQMFGVEAVKATQQIDLVIKMEYWEQNREYDRLGLHEEYMDILGNAVVCHSLPIRPGRNLAVICEAAAVNHRQKKMGYNAAKALSERVMNNMSNTQGDTQ